MPQNKHVFISYKSQEREYAFIVRDYLQGIGYKTWLDYDDLSPKLTGRDEYNWQHEIDIALKTASAVVALVSSASIASRYVTSEWDIAIIERKTIIPLSLDNYHLPAKYSKFDFIDFDTTNHETGLIRIKHRLNADLSDDKPVDNLYEYLKELFSEVSVQIGTSMIRTLKTYGRGEDVFGEPIKLAIQSELGAVLDDVNNFLRLGNGVLLGEPGSGKTTTLLNAVRSRLKRLS